MKKLGLAITLVLGMLALTGPAPASAESTVVRDVGRDMPAVADLVKLRATNGQRKIHIVLHVRDIKRHRGTYEVGVWWSDRTITYAYFVRVRATDAGLVTHFKRSKEGSDVDPAWTCAAKRARLDFQPGRNRITLAVPHGCLRAYDYYKVINNWRSYGFTFRTIDGHFRFDRIDTPKLGRG